MLICCLVPDRKHLVKKYIGQTNFLEIIAALAQLSSVICSLQKLGRIVKKIMIKKCMLFPLVSSADLKRVCQCADTHTSAVLLWEYTLYWAMNKY